MPEPSAQAQEDTSQALRIRSTDARTPETPPPQQVASGPQGSKGAAGGSPATPFVGPGGPFAFGMAYGHAQAPHPAVSSPVSPVMPSGLGYGPQKGTAQTGGAVQSQYAQFSYPHWAQAPPMPSPGQFFPLPTDITAQVSLQAYRSPLSAAQPSTMAPGRPRTPENKLNFEVDSQGRRVSPRRRRGKSSFFMLQLMAHGLEGAANTTSTQDATTPAPITKPAGGKRKTNRKTPSKTGTGVRSGQNARQGSLSDTEIEKLDDKARADADISLIEEERDEDEEEEISKRWSDEEQKVLVSFVCDKGVDEFKLRQTYYVTWVSARSFHFVLPCAIAMFPSVADLVVCSSRRMPSGQRSPPRSRAASAAFGGSFSHAKPVISTPAEEMETSRTFELGSRSLKVVWSRMPREKMER